MTNNGSLRLLIAGSALVCAFPAHAQDADEPRRTRVGLGVQLVPSFPGSDRVSARPLIDVSRARGNRPFEFEAPDESFGFPVLRSGSLSFGPAINLEGGRDAEDVGAELPKVGFTVEAGAFAQYALSEQFRLRGELRKGLGGHRGLIANVGADVVARKNDAWQFSIGPRLTFADDKYQSAYFSVAPEASAASGLPVYIAEEGLQSVGATAGYLQQLAGRWGFSSYVKYDRLVGDAADSPIVRQLGSRNQFSGGIALNYTFGGRD